MNYKEFQNLEAEELKARIINLSNTYSVSKNPTHYARLLKIFISKSSNLSDFVSLTKFLSDKGLSLMNIDRDTRYDYSVDFQVYKTFMGSILGAYGQYLNNQLYKTGPSEHGVFLEALKLVDSLGDQAEKDINWRIGTLKKIDTQNSREVDPIFAYMLNTHGIDILKHSGKSRYYYSDDSSRYGGLYQIVKEEAKNYLDYVFSIAKNSKKENLLNSMVRAMLKDEYKNDNSSLANKTLFLALEEELGIKKEQKMIKESLQKFNKKKLKKKKKEQLLQANNISIESGIPAAPSPKKFKL